MAETRRLLVIDDEENMRHMLQSVLGRLGYAVRTAANGREGLAALAAEPFDTVLCDIRMPEMDGLAFLRRAGEQGVGATIIMMSAYGTTDTALQAMQLGAYDYISKPFKPDEIELTLRKAEERESLRRTNRELQSRLAAMEGEGAFGRMAARSKGMLAVFDLAAKVAPHKTTVLITGESGTGKELIAKVIHHNTARDEPYIAVNCSAIVETLLESELFGHEKGSFTGAIARKLGKFELARYGTVFLDEISEMSLNLQAKLLRVLQEMEFERVGGKDRVRVHARIIAATNKDLRTMVREGKFRDDLFYRLNIVAITLPPLRERPEDIPDLVQYLLAKINIDLHKRIVGVSDEMMGIFLKYRWPGNVRELENLLVRAAVVAKGQILVRGDFPELAEESVPEAVPEEMPPARGGDGKLPTLDDIEEQYIRKVIRESGKNKGEICEILGISRPTFERKLEKYGIVYEKEG